MQNSSRRRVLVGLAAAGVLVLALVGGFVAWRLLSNDAPAEVDLADAVVTLTDDEATGEDDGGDDGGEAAGDDAGEAAGDGQVAGIEGRWTVDTSVGDFDFQSATGSFVGFRIDEELASLGEVTAVGRTGEVEGMIEIAEQTLVGAEIEVDLASITTDDSRRDNRVRGALDTDEFPRARFELTEPVPLPEGAADGEPVAVDAVGELTIRDRTLPTTFAVEAQLVEGRVVMVASTVVALSDFDVEAPSAPIVVSVEDEAIVEMQLILTR